MRLLITTAMVVAAMFEPTHAFADDLIGTLPDGSFANCSQFSATILRWTPSDGPSATFISQQFQAHGSGMWIALGYEANGFWSAEAHASSDACDDCDELSLVRTTSDGRRTSYAVTAAIANYRSLGVEQREQAVRARLYVLAAAQWPAAKLAHNYTFRMPAHQADGTIANYTGWMAEVSKPGIFLLRFGLRAESVMCWCHESWTGYRLAPSNSPAR